MFIGYAGYNAYQIHTFSRVYYEDNADAAIVLGAGTNEGQVSPIFKQRLNHAIYLYEKGAIERVILTGGFGAGQSISDSKAALDYVKRSNVPVQHIFIEERSRYTMENLAESKQIMDSLGLANALIVSDPLHMKRSMAIALKMGINCKPSPTRTSMYQSFQTKARSLAYETFFFTGGRLLGRN